MTTLLLAVTGIEPLVLFGAAFLGAVYSASLARVAALFVVGRWSPARIIVPMILVFTTIVLIASLVNRHRSRRADCHRTRSGVPSRSWLELRVA